MQTLSITLTIAATLMIIVTQVRAEDPKDLVALQDSYLKARSQALAPINKKYVEALSMMKVRYTKEGNLEAALAVDSELKRYQQPQSEAPDLNSTKADLSNKNTVVLFGEWKMEGDGDPYIISDTQTAHHGRDTGACEVKDGVFTILWSNGWRASIALGQRGNTIDVKFFSPKSTTPSAKVWSKVK